MSDESSKTMMVDERQTVRQVLDSLLDKSHCGYSPDWSLVETITELQMGKWAAATHFILPHPNIRLLLGRQHVQAQLWKCVYLISTYIPCFSLFQNVFLRITRTWWKTYSTGPETATTSSCSQSVLKNTLFSRTLRWPPIKLRVVHVTMERINAGSICHIQKPIVYAYWVAVQLREYSSVFV